MSEAQGTPWFARIFWVAACGNLLLVLIPALQEASGPRGQYSGLFVVGLGIIALLLGVVIAIVAMLRKPWAYAVGLALVCVPAVWFVSERTEQVVARVSAPSAEDLNAGRGYFTAPADRALAEAIVAGDIEKVEEHAPAANLNAQGWGNMTFMRLALEHDQPNHTVLAVLLRDGIDPDQAASSLYSLMSNDKDEALLRMVISTGVDLNLHMGKGHWYLFVPYDWLAGLALLLDHGADTEVRDGEGYTPIMRAAQAESWPAIEVLLEHGARTDPTGNDGRTLRDLLSAAIARQNGQVPPGIAELQASLR